MFDKMDQVRDQQERLARLHFELDSQQEMKGSVALPSVDSRTLRTRNLRTPQFLKRKLRSMAPCAENR